MRQILGNGARRWSVAALVLAALSCGREARAEVCGPGTFCAGAASVDMTWHTGAGQGQYGSDGNGLTADRYDPFYHQTKMVPSLGMQSRLYTKAIVIQGADGTKVAYAKTDLYLQQDVLTRRVGELVSGADPLLTEFAVPGLDADHVMLGATHNHSAPEYASTAFGVWLFTDTFDFRMFETTARRIAEAIKRAADALTPAKMGAAVTLFSDGQRNILGPAIADDGSPAGFPRDYFDKELTVIRFQALDGRPIAAWLNLGMHPESLDTTDLISSDFVGMVERFVERGLGRMPGGGSGPVVLWSQGSVGDVEPDRDAQAHPVSARREYWHRNYAQAEKMSGVLSAAALRAWDQAGGVGVPDVPEKVVPLSTDVPVAMRDYRFPGPIAHPLPTVSNCRTDHPALPIVGLPDCERLEEQLGDAPEQFGATLELMRSAGLPVPSNLGAPSYEGVQESLRIHLQTIRLGDVLVASCPCEPISDMVRNFKSRADVAPTNLWVGYDWPCTDDGSSVACDFRTAAHQPPDVRPVDRSAYLRMVAEIHNDAKGWEDDLLSLQGEAEAQDPEAIYGNFTHEEIQSLPCESGSCRGYKLPIMVGQANDYIGYIVTNREYMRGDHYRKALTAFGPHTSDYINTRLVRMAAELAGGPAAAGAVLDPAVGPVDELLQTAKVVTAGLGGTVVLGASEAALPGDGGAPAAVENPATTVERFRAATFTWIGGSNYTDNPAVTVERLDGTTVATQEGGELVLTLKYDSPFSTAPLDWLLGNKKYQWTATWEVFEKTEPATYRFVANGHHRSGGAAVPYVLKSDPFQVSVWRGLTVHDLAVAGETVSFGVGGVELTTPPAQLESDDDGVLSADEVHYPDSYATTNPYIATAVSTSGPYRYCYRCTFRPWADSGRVVSAAVTVKGSEFPATFDGSAWTVTIPGLASGDQVLVDAGDAKDEFGNVNGAAVALTVP